MIRPALDPTLVDLIRSAVRNPGEDTPLSMLADELLGRGDPVGRVLLKWLGGDRQFYPAADASTEWFQRAFRPKRGPHTWMDLGVGGIFRPAGAWKDALTPRGKIQVVPAGHVILRDNGLPRGQNSSYRLLVTPVEHEHIRELAGLLHPHQRGRLSSYLDAHFGPDPRQPQYPSELDRHLRDHAE